MKFNARVSAEEMQELAFGAIGAGLTIIGVAPTHSCFNVAVQNGTNETIVFGWMQEDGLLARIPLFAGGSWAFDMQTNKKGANGDLNWPAHRAIYARQEIAPPGSGKVYVTYFYGAG